MLHMCTSVQTLNLVQQNLWLACTKVYRHTHTHTDDNLRFDEHDLA